MALQKREAWKGGGNKKNTQHKHPNPLWEPLFFEMCNQAEESYRKKRFNDIKKREFFERRCVFCLKMRRNRNFTVQIEIECVHVIYVFV